jgi:hypothetical protein
MSSDNLDTGVETPSEAGVLARLLDLVLGFFVWALHFLAVYVTAAVACVLGLGAADASVRATFVTVLVIVTVVAAAIVVLHALKTSRRHEEVPDWRFLMGITIGHDAIAALGILYQLFPLLMVPVCQ